MIDLSRNLIAQKKITSQLTHSIFESVDKTRLFLQVAYGKFVVERSFPNTNVGKLDMQDFSKEFKCENQVKEYFNL